ncbi:MAG: 4-alpha-glucanotransferase, partial [Elusimicrobiales bacterium]|nr:4-alpha-glucanotransferase [Elusimicrobiales bacterium]
MHRLLETKKTGILLPLFSMYSEDDFGCGDIFSILRWLDFFKELNIDIIQILPINELPPHTNCPYTSLTAFAIDPIYLSIRNLDNISNEIKRKINSKEFKNEIKAIKKSNFINYDKIKEIKYLLLWEQYNFFSKELTKSEPKIKEDFEKYCYENSWWLDDYAIFRRLKDIFSFSSWQDWPKGLRDKEKNSIDKFIKENEFEINFFKYIQWEIDKQF